MEIADCDLEVLVIFEELDDLEKRQEAIQSCKLCQFQEPDGHEILWDSSPIGQDLDEGDWDAGDHVDEEPALDICDG